MYVKHEHSADYYCADSVTTKHNAKYARTMLWIARAYRLNHVHCKEITDDIKSKGTRSSLPSLIAPNVNRVLISEPQ